MFCAMGLSAPAQSTNDAFQLPDGQAREAYRVDIEAVLRERYRQKIDTGVKESILQWTVVDGELPAGLTVRPNGSVVGTPEAAREKPYVFRVAVVDRAIANSSSLMISLSVVIAPPRLRLTRIEGPTLVPMDSSAPPSGGGGSKVSDVSEMSGADVSRPVVTPQPEVKNKHHLPAQAEVAAIPSGGGGNGILKKIAGVVGVQGGGGNTPAKPQGCNKTDVRRAVSDEAHNPLEGDTSTQNTCVEFHNLNTLKYRVEFNTKTTRTEGPDLSTLPFLPKITATTVSPSKQANTPAPEAGAASVRALNMRIRDEAVAQKTMATELKRLDDRFNEVALDVTAAENQLRRIEDRINLAITDVQTGHDSSVRLANSADFYLQANNTGPLLTDVRDTKGRVEAALRNDWPSDDLTTVMNNLSDYALRLERLRLNEKGEQDVSQEAWTEWLSLNQDRYSGVKERISELKTKITTVNSGAENFNKAKNKVAGWLPVLENVNKQGASAFQQRAFVSCQTDEAETKSSKLTITKVDRTIENASAITREVLTVHCYSRVSFTAGFNFSTLDEKEFSVVQSAGAESGSTVKKFGFTNRSSFRPNPLALVNFRFTDQPTINWHASFGAVVDLKGQTGTDVEPIAGVSFSIRRLIFITPFALHFGRVNKLAGGFNEGDVVPESIATPPIEKAWKIGYTGGITFRIAPQ